MKKLIFTLTIGLICFIANAQTATQQKTKQQPTEIKDKVVEIACGECQFKMEGKSCDLAVTIDGKSYFVDGKKIDDFGDAHDKEHGFCNATSKAKVTAEIVNNRFKAKTITLIPPTKQ